MKTIATTTYKSLNIWYCLNVFVLIPFGTNTDLNKTLRFKFPFQKIQQSS